MTHAPGRQFSALPLETGKLEQEKHQLIAFRKHQIYVAYTKLFKLLKLRMTTNELEKTYSVKYLNYSFISENVIWILIIHD